MGIARKDIWSEMSSGRTTVAIHAAIGLGLLALMAWACSNEPRQPAERSMDAASVEEPLIEANKAAVQTEDEQIEDLLNRYNWDMETSETGLRYLIDDEGYGEKIGEGDRVTLEYAVKLITGDVVYSSEDSGPMEFTVGREDVIAGLHQGVRLLRNGGKARFVIPSYLAYGLIGDNNKIGKKATLIYKVHVIDVN
jgi:gliding motility-associated peptidyl-prolyl isomerase